MKKSTIKYHKNSGYNQHLSQYQSQYQKLTDDRDETIQSPAFLEPEFKNSGSFFSFTITPVKDWQKQAQTTFKQDFSDLFPTMRWPSDQ